MQIIPQIIDLELLDQIVARVKEEVSCFVEKFLYRKPKFNRSLIDIFRL